MSSLVTFSQKIKISFPPATEALHSVIRQIVKSFRASETKQKLGKGKVKQYPSVNFLFFKGYIINVTDEMLGRTSSVLISARHLNVDKVQGLQSGKLTNF